MLHSLRSPTTPSAERVWWARETADWGPQIWGLGQTTHGFVYSPLGVKESVRLTVKGFVSHFPI